MPEKFTERGHWLVLADFDAEHLPISIQSVILSRLDGLKEDWRQVLQAAAVIGRVFPKKVLKGALPGGLDLDQVLWEMEDRGLVYQDRAIPDEEFSFRHVLVQEAVYHNILRRQRQTLHLAVAEAIEKLYPGHLEQFYEALAYHYEKSGKFQQTINYLFKAGEKASLNFDNETALNHFSRGLELLRSMPETPERHQQELEFLTAMGVSLVHSRGHADDQVLETYTQAYQLCQETGYNTHLYDILLGLRRYALTSGHPAESVGYSRQMLELGTKHADLLEQARAYMMLVESLYYLADFSHVIEYGCQGLALCSDQDPFAHIRQYGNDTRLGCQMFLPQALWLLGYPDQALAELESEQSLLASVTHPFSRAMGQFFISSAYQLLRQPQAVETLAQELLQTAEDYGYALYQELGLVQLGWALAAQDQLNPGISRLSQGIDGLRLLKATVFMTTPLGCLGAALAQSGRVAEGLAAIDEGLAISQENGIIHFLPELYRLKGEVLFKEKDEPGAEACYSKALELAHSQHARSWELRFTTSLARLWQAQGRKKVALDLLDPVYNWFTEGFNTPDLCDAKILLDQLS
jgi:tetratricopeptide (TPR) repeat protein